MNEIVNNFSNTTVTDSAPPIKAKRAMRESDKALRQAAILKVALELFLQSSFNSLTMAHIARASGLAKGTLYLYFTTKEELFLAVQQELLYDWFDEVDKSLEGGEQFGIAQIVELFSRSLQRRPALTRLLALSNTILEQNIEPVAALNYKQRLLLHLNRTGALLEKRLPFIRPSGQGAIFLLQTQALVVGLQNLAEPPSVVQGLIERSELQILKVNFESEFARMLNLLLEGWKEEYNNE